jgi:hypothetical protein
MSDSNSYLNIDDLKYHSFCISVNKRSPKILKLSYEHYNHLKSPSIRFFFVALRPNASQGLLIFEVSRLHSLDTPQSVGLLWTSDQPDAETST